MLKIYLNGTVGYEITLADIIDQINASNEKEVKLIINSGGGDLMEGLAIYNYLKNCGKTLHTEASGIVASIATVIFLSAKSENRLINENSFFMIHDPSIFAFDDLNIQKGEDILEILNKTKNSITKIYADECAYNEAELSELMRNETYMDANEAITAGFAHALTEETAKVSANIGLKFLNSENLPDQLKNQDQDPDGDDQDQDHPRAAGR